MKICQQANTKFRVHEKYYILCNLIKKYIRAQLASEAFPNMLRTYNRTQPKKGVKY